MGIVACACPVAPLRCALFARAHYLPSPRATSHAKPRRGGADGGAHARPLQRWMVTVFKHSARACDWDCDVAVRASVRCALRIPGEMGCAAAPCRGAQSVCNCSMQYYVVGMALGGDGCGERRAGGRAGAESVTTRGAGSALFFVTRWQFFVLQTYPCVPRPG